MDVESIIAFQSIHEPKIGLDKAFPWYSERTRSIGDPILRMHNETIDFCLFMAPTCEEHDRAATSYHKYEYM